MAKQKHSEFFTNPGRMRLEHPSESSFEQVVRSLQLSPDTYANSPELKAWVRRNKKLKFVPPDLLATFGFEAGQEE